MGEGAAAVAVSQRPDSRHVRAQFVIHLDEAAIVHRDAGNFQSEVIGVRTPADRHEQVRSDDL